MIWLSKIWFYKELDFKNWDKDSYSTETEAETETGTVTLILTNTLLPTKGFSVWKVLIPYW